MDLIWQSLYLILPAYFANAACTLSNKWNWLARPLDHGKKIGDNYILGPGKTYRGTIIGLVTAIVTVLLQKFLFSVAIFQNISLFDYQQINWLGFGLLGGLGAVGGDIVASFFKRRFNLKRGAPAPLLDQWDFVIGFFFLTSLLISVTWPIIITTLILTLIIHPLTNMVAYLLKIKAVWW